jgi:hypothetical protein
MSAIARDWTGLPHREEAFGTPPPGFVKTTMSGVDAEPGGDIGAAVPVQVSDRDAAEFPGVQNGRRAERSVAVADQRHQAGRHRSRDVGLAVAVQIPRASEGEIESGDTIAGARTSRRHGSGARSGC